MTPRHMPAVANLKEPTNNGPWGNLCLHLGRRRQLLVEFSVEESMCVHSTLRVTCDGAVWRSHHVEFVASRARLPTLKDQSEL